MTGPSPQEVPALLPPRDEGAWGALSCSWDKNGRSSEARKRMFPLQRYLRLLGLENGEERSGE